MILPLRSNFTHLQEHDEQLLRLGMLAERYFADDPNTLWRTGKLGADGGADILAGMGALGFGTPQLCVEVKSELKPIDRPTVDKLLGAMSKFNAPHGLFAAWGGFRGNVQKELVNSFFKVRPWPQKELLDSLFVHYDQLAPDLKAELPLKRIRTVAAQEE